MLPQNTIHSHIHRVLEKGHIHSGIVKGHIHNGLVKGHIYTQDRAEGIEGRVNVQQKVM